MFGLVAVLGIGVIAFAIIIAALITLLFRYIINKVAKKPMEVKKQRAAMILMGIAACAIVFAIVPPFAVIPLCVLGYQIIKLW